MLRLLVCGHCKTIEELPDYDGPVEYDTLLENLVSRHQFPSGTPHAPATLGKVSEDDWGKPHVRQEIVKQISGKLTGTSETGLGSEYYDTRDTFQEDALACFNKHSRNPGCPDYKSDSKRLTSGAEKDIKAEFGIDIRADRRSDRWLCEFCPVHSLVEQARRRKAGLDK